MATTQWGIVYGTANPHIRRRILPDDDRELDDPRLVGPGEKLIKVPILQSEQPHAYEARIAAAVCTDAGIAALVDARFAEIDAAGNVVMVHIGDAALFSGPNTYVNCPRIIQKGHTYDHATGIFTIPSQTLQPKAGARASISIVPATTVAAGFSAAGVATAL